MKPVMDPAHVIIEAALQELWSEYLEYALWP